MWSSCGSFPSRTVIRAVPPSGRKKMSTSWNVSAGVALTGALVAGGPVVGVEQGTAVCVGLAGS
jgi:hypothetical protein